MKQSESMIGLKPHSMSTRIAGKSCAVLLVTLMHVAPHAAWSQQIQSLEHAVQGVGNSLVQMNADTYVLAYQEGGSQNGFIKTFTIPADGTSITQVQTLEHEPVVGRNFSMVQVDADTVAVAYEGPDEDGFLKTFTISADGTSITQVQSLEHETDRLFKGSLVRVDADTYALAYADSDGDGVIKTFTISADGSTITQVQSLKHDTSGGADSSLVQVDADTYALAYRAPTRGFIKTFFIPADGSLIVEVQSIEHDDTLGLDNSLIQVDADTYALAYRGFGEVGILKTFTISADGSTITQIQSLEHSTRGGANSLIQIDADTYALAYTGPDFDGFLKTLTISADGSSIAQVQVVEHDTNRGGAHSLIKVDADTYALAYLGDGFGGFVKTFGIASSGIMADLAITKTDGVTSAIPGLTTLVYTIVATNNGASEDPAVSVADTFSADLTCSYISVAAGGATGNTADGTGDLAETLSMPAGSSVTYTANCTIDPTATGTLSNTATISSLLPDFTPGNDSATDADTVLAATTDLAISKTDGVTAAISGVTTLVYTIVATNNGPNDDPSVSVGDAFPSDLTCTYTSVAAGGVTGNTAAGAGDLAETLSMPSGSSVIYTASCSIDPTATGTLSNTATIAGSVADPAQGNNSATDSDTVLATQTDLQITKTDSVTSAIPGQTTLVYTIVAANNGPNDDPSVSVGDTFPSDLSCTFTSVAAGGATGNTAAGAGDLAETLSMPFGSSITYTAICAIDPAATGTLSNTATITASVTDPAPSDNSATEADTVLAPEADLAITKTDGVLSAIPGQSLTYTIVATNKGPSDDPSVTVTDVFPAALTGITWSCSATPGSSCVAAGAGDLNEVGILQAGGSLTFLATGSAEPAFVGVLTNSASVGTGAGVTDPDTSNNSAIDTTTVASAAVLSAAKTVVGDFREGGTIFYRITLFNAGVTAHLDNPEDELVDVLPPELTLLAASANSGVAAIDLPQNTVTWNGSIPANGMVELEIEALINNGASGSTVSNQATVFFDSDGNGTNESSVLTDDPNVVGGGDATIFLVVTLAEVPTLSDVSLILIILLLAVSALRSFRHQRIILEGRASALPVPPAGPVRRPRCRRG